MVISHKYRYLFIEIPLTGSWAIYHELCKHYGGIPILHKHASYPEFLQTATVDEKEFFVFAGLRNPLDTAVSSYFKYKTDHKNAFSNPEHLKSMKVDSLDVKRFEFIRDTNASFKTFFMQSSFWERPYSGMFELSSNHLDFVIRHENLQDDFTEVLRILGIAQVRPVPILNKTQGREADWRSYYTPPMIEKAKRVYGPFMMKWGYEFPDTWGEYRVSWKKQMEFRFVTLMMSIYLSNFRYSERTYARIVRELRARVRRFI